MNILNYINGAFLESSSKESFDNFNPATGKVLGTVPKSGADDVELAVITAQNAFGDWSTLTAKERADYLYKIADKLTDNLDELAYLESIDNGKPISLSKKMDIPRAIDNFRFFAGAILHEDSQAFITDNKAINYVHQSPIGVVGCISPWNLPLYLFTWKIAPALASGCTVVAKPSEVTPLTAYYLSKICDEVGLPKGVLNILHGFGAEVGNSIVSHKDILAISFTGGTKTGAHIASVAAPMFKKLSLELGGKNPNIIFDDCNFDKMLETTVRSSFTNQGQICLCGSRILVQRTIYDKFLNKFVEKVAKLKVGNPLNPDTQVGAIVSQMQYDKVLAYIELAKKEGGKIDFGGNPISLQDENKDGLFISPTIITELDAFCRVNQEEIFGPIVTVIPFDDEQEALTIANATGYGLSCTIWTQDISKAHRISHKINAGVIWINCWLLRDLRTPFGGMKNSGVGREGGTYALDFFREKRNVCIQYD